MINQPFQVARVPPQMERDKFWESSVPKELPYTIAALPFRRETDPFSLTKDSSNVDVPVNLFNGNASRQLSSRQLSTPLPGFLRRPSVFSVSRQASFLSSIRGAMMGRRTSDTYSEWSHEAGM